MKKFRVFFLIFIIIIVNSISIFAITDNKIFTDTVYNIYEGTIEAKPLISNLKFNDIPKGHWAKEAITKAGALNMVKGYGNKYNPNSNVSNQEALAFAIRVIGLEKEAQQEGQRLKTQAADNNPASIWSVGYLSLSRNRGLITNQQFNEAISQNQDRLPETAFKRENPATREQVATWIVQALNTIRQTPLVSNNQQSIYNYSDWIDTSVEHLENVEIALDNGIIKGDSNGKLNPKGALTRAEMAQILSNMDNIYNEAVGLTKKAGTVGGIKDVQTTQTGKANLERNIFIRNDEGKVEILKYAIESSSSVQPINKDSVVYNNGTATGLSSLREGNQIEYLVNNANKTVQFVSVKDKSVNNSEISGKLNKIDYENGIIQITDKSGKVFSYYVIDGIVGKDENGNYSYISEQKRKEKDIPIGSMVKLESKNNVITKITYVGEATLSKELRGIVIENNPDFSYITVLDKNENEVTKNYFADEIVVEKQPHYQSGDEIGYLDQMFPNFNYDPRDTTIDQIETGDIVFITTNKDNSDQIEKISASPNYFMKYGKVAQITNGIDVIKMLVEFDNGQTAWYDFPSAVFVSKGGKPVSANNIVAGDWVKLLVNEAVLSPGEIMESIKEIIIEESGHLIGDILKGQVGSINPIQKQVSIQHSYKLGKSGWEDYKEIRQLSLANSDIIYYYNGKRVPLDFVQRYLKRSNGEVYIALEKNYSGNVVAKATFRIGRDEPLEPDTIINVDGIGGFVTAGNGTIKTDDGTIVRKNGRLVDPSNIAVNDYARISLNGDGKAGIVDIYEAPMSNSIMIARGRVSKVDENKNFVVKSMSQLNGNSWDYSPVERKFTIDGNTLYITEDGVKNINEFIGYTDKTVIDKAFTIVFDGSKATHIIDVPYSTKLVSGTVYDTSEKFSLKDGKYMKNNNVWDLVSIKDPTINLDVKDNTLIVKNNKVIPASGIQKGDKVRVFTEKLPDKIVGGMTVNARIIFVEN